MADRTSGGLRALRGTVTGESYPVAKAVWNGTASNETTVVLGAEVVADGRGSYDAEDAPTGDADGTALVYDWNLSSAPGGLAAHGREPHPTDANATPSSGPTRWASTRSRSSCATRTGTGPRSRRGSSCTCSSPTTSRSRTRGWTNP